MYKVEFVRNEKVFENCSRYFGKRLRNQRDFLEYEMKYGRKQRLEILTTIYEDLGFGKVIIKIQEPNEYYNINGHVCVLSNDIDISEIEKFFQTKATKNKLFKSLTNLSYFIYTDKGLINFNNFDLKIGDK